MDNFAKLLVDVITALGGEIEEVKPTPESIPALPDNTNTTNECDCGCEAPCCYEADDEFIPARLSDVITKVSFQNPHTIVWWYDGTITRVKCSEGDTFDPEKGLAMAFMKASFGNRYFRDMTKIIKNSDVNYEVKKRKKPAVKKTTTRKAPAKKTTAKTTRKTSKTTDK